MSGSKTTFILSTGRCGTQWLSASLAECYGDLAVVTHEPIKRAYRPRTLLGSRDLAALPDADFVDKHLAQIESHLATRPYIECGWPCYGALRNLAQRFAGRIRIVHLVRHPVPTAASMVTHLYYHEPDRPDRLNELALLTPDDAGASFPEYRERWDRMERFEKCLYFWAEINALGLRLEAELGVPWFRVKTEEIFRSDGLDRLLDFLELPRRETMIAARAKRVDQYMMGTNVPLRAAVIAEHPRVMELARAFGYDPLDYNENWLNARYAFTPPEGTRNAIPWGARWRNVPRNAPCPCGSGLRYKTCHGTIV